MQNKLHISIFEMLFITTSVAVFFGLRQIAIRSESNAFATIFMLSSVPIGLLVTSVISISGRNRFYSAFSGVAVCAIWGSALGFTFSHPGTLAELVDPGAYLPWKEIWIVLVPAQSVAVGLLLVGVNALAPPRP